MTNGNWALKQCEHCSWRSKCFERGCFQTCPWVSHMKCQLYILFLGSKPGPSGLGPSCWWCLLPLRVASVFLSRFTSDYTSWTSCQWWTTWASWTDWAPQIGSIRNWPLRHCAKNHLQRIFRAKLQDKEATHLPRYFQVFWCTFGHMKKTSRVRSNVVRFSMDNLQEPLVWSCRRGKRWTCFLHPIGRWSVRKGGHGRQFQSLTSSGARATKPLNWMPGLARK